MALGVFSAMLISYSYFYPQIAVAGTMFTGESGRVCTRDCDELGKAGEGDERRIELRIQALGSLECDSCMQNHTRRFSILKLCFLKTAYSYEKNKGNIDGGGGSHIGL